MADLDIVRTPLATYRLQLRREFPFASAAALVPYAHALGISDFYCSPVFLSTPGSSHGYDVNDYRRIDPQLGGMAELDRLHVTLKERGMGMLLDFVPNHMGINGPGLLNSWWRDVLQNGAHSAHARFFDIDWNSGTGEQRVRVLVPILDDHYGRVLAAGRLGLVYAGGELSVAYGDMRFPVAPQTYQRLLESLEPSSSRSAELTGLANRFAALPRPVASEENEAARIRSAQLNELMQHFAALLESDLETRQQVEERLSLWNDGGGGGGRFDVLNAILERQHYRLAYWKAGVHEINYRRFFAIDTLIGLRVEIPEVFQETHALLARLVREEIVTGLRIDHIDGLRDPQQYLERLQSLAADDSGNAKTSCYVVVEKILAENETLPPEWPVSGTTGYEFIEQVAGVLVDARAEQHITKTHAAFVGDLRGFDEIVVENKRLVLDDLFANAVMRLAAQLTDILQADLRWRDMTRHELTVAVREMMAGYGVYRTYRRDEQKMSERDRRVVEQACAIALRRNPRFGPEPFELVRDVLTGVYPGEAAAKDLQSRLCEWVLSFQQYTGAVMAKAVEDTSFYIYSRFIALNEVGGNPGRFGGTVAAFHATNVEHVTRSPRTLLATATHDTKLGEDVRARLYALSEIPHDWNEAVFEWREMNQRHKQVIDGRPAPDANEEYRLYQILLGAWPAADTDPDDAFRQRLREHVRKSVNEARRNTSWVQPNEAWLEAGDLFLDHILGTDTGREFLASFRPRARRLADLGMVNSLAQLVLKAMSPGIPDFYQGAELWDLSLVDPDNRRPVDFALRESMILRSEDDLPWTALLRDWRTGEIKLQLTRRLLRIRGVYGDVFERGDYRGLETSHRFAPHIIAFARTAGKVTIVVVVPRLTSRLGCPPLGLVWDDTTVMLPEVAGSWREAITGRTFINKAAASIAELFTDLPLAVLVNDPGADSSAIESRPPSVS